MLFRSGSGVMACEALRRGVEVVEAVEADRRIAAVAAANLKLVAEATPHLQHAEVHHREVLAWLAMGLGARPRGFDLVYADPPYRAGLHRPIAEALWRGGWLAPDGLLIWECASDAIPAVPSPWRVWQERRYGGTTVVMLDVVTAAGSTEC